VWITRHCELTIRSSDPDVPTESGSEDCTNEPEFEALRDNFKGQSSHLVGYADVQVTYASPVNGESQTEVLKVNARDPEFYYLREQDKIRIDVNKEKPTDIRFIDRPKV
jgi:hypothetical protein